MVLIVTTTIKVVSLQCHTHSVSLNNSLYGTVVAAWLNILCITRPRVSNDFGPISRSTFPKFSLI